MPADVGGQDPAGTPHRPRMPGNRSRGEPIVAQPRPGSVAGCIGTNGHAQFHADEARARGRSDNRALRSPHSSEGGRRDRLAPVDRGKQRGLRVLEERGREVRCGILGSGRWDHSSGRFGELRLSWGSHHRNGLTHSERRGVGRMRGRSRGRGRGRGHGRTTLGSALPSSHWHSLDRQEEWMDGSEGRDLAGSG